MSFAISTFHGQAGNQSGTVYRLGDPAGRCRAEIWPFCGFNCLRWQVQTAEGRLGDLLYTAPDWATNPVPTRSGHPVLFPFPNRLRAGRFTANGRVLQLPLNDSSQNHAIHGFTPRNSWRVLKTSTGSESATISGQFRLRQDRPDLAELWPGDGAITLTYMLSPSALQVEAVIENFGTEPLPFGLGYHPYFQIPTAPGAAVDELILQTKASRLWRLQDNIPDGNSLPVPPELDFRAPRELGPVMLDHLYGGLEAASPTTNGRAVIATLSHRSAPGRLEIEADSAFGHLVLFTPPHRQAIAIEPYTCITDAANLSRTIPDSGWRLVKPGEKVMLSVRYRWYC